MTGAEVCKVFPITGAGVWGLSITACPAVPSALLHLLSARDGRSGQPVSSPPWAPGWGSGSERTSQKPEAEASEWCLQGPRGPPPVPLPRPRGSGFRLQVVTAPRHSAYTVTWAPHTKPTSQHSSPFSPLGRGWHFLPSDD